MPVSLPTAIAEHTILREGSRALFTATSQPQDQGSCASSSSPSTVPSCQGAQPGVQLGCQGKAQVSRLVGCLHKVGFTFNIIFNTVT